MMVFECLLGRRRWTPHGATNGSALDSRAGDVSASRPSRLAVFFRRRSLQGRRCAPTPLPHFRAVISLPHRTWGRRRSLPSAVIRSRAIQSAWCDGRTSDVPAPRAFRPHAQRCNAAAISGKHFWLVSGAVRARRVATMSAASMCTARRTASSPTSAMHSHVFLPMRPLPASGRHTPATDPRRGRPCGGSRRSFVVKLRGGHAGVRQSQPPLLDVVLRSRCAPCWMEPQAIECREAPFAAGAPVASLSRRGRRDPNGFVQAAVCIGRLR